MHRGHGPSCHDSPANTTWILYAGQLVQGPYEALVGATHKLIFSISAFGSSRSDDAKVAMCFSTWSRYLRIPLRRVSDASNSSDLFAHRTLKDGDRAGAGPRCKAGSAKTDPAMLQLTFLARSELSMSLDTEARLIRAVEDGVFGALRLLVGVPGRDTLPDFCT